MVPLWAFFVVTTAHAVASLEAGYRLGRWRHARSSEEKEAPIGAMVGSILGLLAIMLAFTFNLAASRFDARRQTILQEANAVGTAYLRTRRLPEPQQSQIAAMLREHVDVRIRGSHVDTVAEGIVRSEELRQQLWEQAITAAQKNPDSIMTALFLQSLNEVIDLHARRVRAGLHSRIPISLWLALFRSRPAGNAFHGLSGRPVRDAAFARRTAPGHGVCGRAVFNRRPGPRTRGDAQNQPAGDDGLATNHASSRRLSAC